jgi:hypothetical protein
MTTQTAAPKVDGNRKRQKTGGRTKGTPNRTTAAAKDAIQMVANDLGGPARMLEWVKEDPFNERVFWKDIYPKLLPLQINGAGEEGEHIHRLEHVIVDPQG